MMLNIKGTNNAKALMLYCEIALGMGPQSLVLYFLYNTHTGALTSTISLCL